MKKNYSKLKIVFQDDPEMLRSLEAQEQMEKLEEVRAAREMEFGLLLVVLFYFP